MPRPPKATAILKMQGTYQECRHGERIDELATGEPERPKWLDSDAAEFWTWMVPHLTELGITKSVDTAELAAMCRWWTLWRQVDAELQTGEGNRFRLLTEAGMAWKQFSAIASKYGLTPSDRAKLQSGDVKEQSEFMDLITKSG